MRGSPAAGTDSYVIHGGMPFTVWLKFSWTRTAGPAGCRQPCNRGMASCRPKDAMLSTFWDQTEARAYEEHRPGLILFIYQAVLGDRRHRTSRRPEESRCPAAHLPRPPGWPRKRPCAPSAPSLRYRSPCAPAPWRTPGGAGCREGPPQRQAGLGGQRQPSPQGGLCRGRAGSVTVRNLGDGALTSVRPPATVVGRRLFCAGVLSKQGLTGWLAGILRTWTLSATSRP
jgi:hypothetical protein